MGPKIAAVARAGPRNGRSVWEVRELYLPQDRVPDFPEMLEELSAHAAAARAVRVAMRVPQSEETAELARAAGFVRQGEEYLYCLPAERRTTRPAHEIAAPDSLGLKPRTAEDRHGLFRLYCFTTPVSVRSQAGMTATEWWDAQEWPPGRTKADYVLKGATRTHAWVRAGVCHAGEWVLLSADEEASTQIGSLVGAVLDGGANAYLLTLIPAYDVSWQNAAEEMGFEWRRTFELMTRSLAMRTRQPARAFAAIG